MIQSVVHQRVTAINPASLISHADLKPGELAIFLHYAEFVDGYNFDAQNQSFAWLAAQRGIDVCLMDDPGAQHSLFYFRRSHEPAFVWLSCHLVGPVQREARGLPRQ